MKAPTRSQGDGMMKASVYRRYGAPEVLMLEEVRRPRPGAGEVLVRNSASIVSAAETAARAGKPYVARLFFGLRRPKWAVLGSNFSGEVASLGSGVTRFKVGEPVFGVNVKEFGGHAEYLVVPEDGVIAPKPARLSDGEAVAVYDGSFTALPFLRDSARLRPGQSILINGASGAVGTAAIQLAKHYGATVTAVCSGRNLDLVRSLGADIAIDYTTEDFTRKRDAYDVIFDAVGKSTFGRSRRALRPGGSYLTTVPSLAILLQMLWTSRFGKRKAAIAFTGLRKTADIAADLLTISQLAGAGALVPVIDKTYPLALNAEAHRYVDTGRKRGSVVITIGAAS